MSYGRLFECTTGLNLFALSLSNRWSLFEIRKLNKLRFFSIVFSSYWSWNSMWMCSPNKLKNEEGQVAFLSVAFFVSLVHSLTVFRTDWQSKSFLQAFNSEWEQISRTLVDKSWIVIRSCWCRKAQFISHAIPIVAAWLQTKYFVLCKALKQNTYGSANS